MDKEKEYNLQGMLIGEWDKEGKHYIGYRLYWDGGEREGLFYTAGHVWIEGDIAIVGTWKIREGVGNENFQSIEEVNSYIEKLPKWDKTKYFIKIPDLGLTDLRDCKTGEVIDTPDINKMLGEIGFRKMTKEEYEKQIKEDDENPF